MTTATTGLKPAEDQLMVVHVRSSSSSVSCFTRNVPEELRVKAQDYHRVSRDWMDAHAFPDDEFRERLGKELDGKVVFTYNVPFQVSFLERWMDRLPVLVSLPHVVKTIKSGLYKINEDMGGAQKLKALEQAAAKMSVPGFAKFISSELGSSAVSWAAFPACDENCQNLWLALEQALELEVFVEAAKRLS